MKDYLSKNNGLQSIPQAIFQPHLPTNAQLPNFGPINVSKYDPFQTHKYYFLPKQQIFPLLYLERLQLSRCLIITNFNEVLCYESSFRSSHKSSSFRHLPVEFSPTEVETWIFFLKSLQQQLFLQLFFFHYIQISMSLENAAPPHTFLGLLKFNNQLLCSCTILFLLDVPHRFLGIHYPLKLMFEVRRSVFESYTQFFGFDYHTENVGNFDLRREWRELNEA